MPRLTGFRNGRRPSGNSRRNWSRTWFAWWNVMRLEGNFSSLRIQKNPDSVLITDAAAIPLAFKQVVLAMRAYVWEALLQTLGLEERKTWEACVDKLEFKPDKKAIGVELKTGTEIPSADLKFGDWRLVIT
jgi:hypothetical protein